MFSEAFWMWRIRAVGCISSGKDEIMWEWDMSVSLQNLSWCKGYKEQITVGKLTLIDILSVGTLCVILHSDLKITWSCRQDQKDANFNMCEAMLIVWCCTDSYYYRWDLDPTVQSQEQALIFLMVAHPSTTIEENSCWHKCRKSGDWNFLGCWC